MRVPADDRCGSGELSPCFSYIGVAVDGDGVVKRLDALRATNGEWNARMVARREGTRGNMLVGTKGVWGYSGGVGIRAKIGAHDDDITNDRVRNESPVDESDEEEELVRCDARSISYKPHKSTRSLLGSLSAISIRSIPRLSGDAPAK